MKPPTSDDCVAPQRRMYRLSKPKLHTKTVFNPMEDFFGRVAKKFSHDDGSIVHWLTRLLPSQ